MVFAPPLIIQPSDIDVMIERARKSLDETYAEIKADGLLKAA